MTIEQREMTEKAVIQRVDSLLMLLFDQFSTLQSFNKNEALMLLPNIQPEYYFNQLRYLQERFQKDVGPYQAITRPDSKFTFVEGPAVKKIIN